MKGSTTFRASRTADRPGVDLSCTRVNPGNLGRSNEVRMQPQHCGLNRISWLRSSQMRFSRTEVNDRLHPPGRQRRSALVRVMSDAAGGVFGHDPESSIGDVVYRMDVITSTNAAIARFEVPT